MRLLQYFLPPVLLPILFSSQADAREVLPNVTLPWGTWRANSVDSNNILTFNNIRFGKPPVGKLRFQLPQSPEPVSSPNRKLMDNSYGPACYQVSMYSNCTAPKPAINASEDCLFLDVYVPKSVWQQAQNGNYSAPVVVWIYGGAYEYGAKSAYGPSAPFYQGNGIIAAAQNYSEEFIFVAGNYRLGAFGWLAGPVMEQKATANAGLYDQRLLLQWVQDHIHLFGGNKSHVSAWGESAGASSILHHLMAFNGTQDPLFQHVFVQSPAFQWNWDRSPGGTLQQVYNNFTKLANCTEGDFKCLVKADAGILAKANQELYDQSTAVGLMPVGPSIDSKWVQELPTIAYQSKNIWPGLKSLTVSHVQYEATNFIPTYIETEDDFQYFLNNFIRERSLAKVKARISDQYPVANYSSQKDRVGAVIQDAIFVCNTRTMYNGYNTSIDNIYMMNYDFGYTYATHASDLLPTFWTSDSNVTSFLETYMCIPWYEAVPYTKWMSYFIPSTYQSYLADLAMTGDPNAHAKSVPWPAVTLDDAGDVFQNVMDVGLSQFGPISDPLNSWDVCGFWYQIAQDIVEEISIMNANLHNSKEQIIVQEL